VRRDPPGRVNGDRIVKVFVFLKRTYRIYQPIQIVHLTICVNEGSPGESIRVVRQANYLSPIVYRCCKTFGVIPKSAEVCHLSLMKEERVEQAIPSDRRHADDVIFVIYSVRGTVVRSIQSTQIPYVSVLPLNSMIA
jgi:hypothetical protein